MSDEKDAFEGWAKLELMGHRVMWGRLSEQEIAGKGFIRIDIPGGEHGRGVTQFYSPESVYAISPVTEELGRAMARKSQGRPVALYDLPEEWREPIREAMRRKQIEQKAEEPGLVPGDEEFEEPEDLGDDEMPI